MPPDSLARSPPPSFSRLAAPPPPHCSSRSHRRARLTHGPHSAHVRENSRRIYGVTSIRSPYISFSISLSLSLLHRALRARNSSHALPTTSTASGNEARVNEERHARSPDGIAGSLARSSLTGSSMKCRVAIGVTATSRRGKFARLRPRSHPDEDAPGASDFADSRWRFRHDVRRAAPSNCRALAPPRKSLDRACARAATADRCVDATAVVRMIVKFRAAATAVVATPTPLGKFSRARGEGKSSEQANESFFRMLSKKNQLRNRMACNKHYLFLASLSFSLRRNILSTLSTRTKLETDVGGKLASDKTA